jgi:hypothetical protein
MRTTVRLNDALLARAKREAAKRKVTLTALIEHGLHLALVEKTRVLPVSTHLPSWDSGGTLPGVDLNNSAALLDIMEGRD